ncbi:MAG: HD domain-containing protein [Candidatus Aenigmarchaeota archaeon]|nr:HD domain-containing protein [Candidatus Aenigmarchaeota archaeon]
MPKENDAAIASFLFEIGALKRTARTGWAVSGIPKPDTVASHIFRAAHIGNLLAEMEGCDKNKVVRMILFHDVPEARIGDLHKIASSYIDVKESEASAAEDQAKLLPPAIAKEYTDMLKEFVEKKTKEAIVARDADYLEAAISGKEYLMNGYVHAQEYIDRVREVLVTKSAKKLLEEIEKSDGFWWKGLKKKF